MHWEKLTHEEIEQRIFSALRENKNYDSEAILGVPGTYLDTEEFHHDAPFLKNAPFLSTLVANPNHIGCHTLNKDKSEDIFRGTQRLEIELIDLIATEIFKAAPDTVDGYVAPGGTEANIQAMWIYRNFYMTEFNAQPQEIAVIFSEDSHYSMPKGANLLNIQSSKINVNKTTRSMDLRDLEVKVGQLKNAGVNYFIVVANMATSMLGSVDDVDAISAFFESRELPYKLHVDGAFGGFIYPFTAAQNNKLNFSHPSVSSITLDAHKMLQAPFGTGIFLARKGLMPFAGTKDAQYVQGLDYTICGSRSGANVIAVWMILMTYGSEGWNEKLNNLIALTDRLAAKLDELEIRYYRNKTMNIVAIDARDISDEIANKYRLVANTYNGKPEWWKIVVMPHVKEEVLWQFLEEVTEDRKIHFNHE